jgi:hypothetical protein
LGGHLIAAWQETVAAEAAARHQSLWVLPRPVVEAYRRIRELQIPMLPANFAQGGAVAAAAALSLFLMTSPDLRQGLSREISLGSQSGRQATAQQSFETASLFNFPALYPELPEEPVLPAWQFKPVTRRTEAPVEVAANQPSQVVLERFEPPQNRRFLPSHSVLDLAPPPPVRPQLNASGHLLAQANVDDQLPPPRRSKVAAFFQRTGSGVKNAFGIFR